MLNFTSIAQLRIKVCVSVVGVWFLWYAWVIMLVSVISRSLAVLYNKMSTNILVKEAWKVVGR